MAFLVQMHRIGGKIDVKATFALVVFFDIGQKVR
jgi:hypothetical protein